MDAVLVAVRAAVSLAVVLGVVWYLHRRMTRGAGAGTRQVVKPVSLIGRQSVGQKASVVVIEVDGTRFLLGVTEQSVSVLHSGEAPVPVPAEVPAEAKDAAFARSMTTAVKAAGPSHRATAMPVAASTAFLPPSAGTFAGSILSPATWRQAATVLKPSR